MSDERLIPMQIDDRASDGSERLLKQLGERARAEGDSPGASAAARSLVGLGASLLSLRLARGLTQSELAILSGVQQADISRIERAALDPRATTLLRMLSGLEANLSLGLSEGDTAPDWHLIEDRDSAPMHAQQTNASGRLQSSLEGRAGT